MDWVSKGVEALFKHGGVDIIGWGFALIVLAGSAWFVKSVLTWILTERTARDKEMVQAVRELSKEIQENTHVLKFHTKVIERLIERSFK